MSSLVPNERPACSTPALTPSAITFTAMKSRSGRRPRRDTDPLDVERFLKPGESFRLKQAKDFYGAPALEGTVRESTINIPMQHDFAAFVLLKRDA